MVRGSVHWLFVSFETGGAGDEEIWLWVFFQVLLVGLDVLEELVARSKGGFGLYLACCVGVVTWVALSLAGGFGGVGVVEGLVEADLLVHLGYLRVYVVAPWGFWGRYVTWDLIENNTVLGSHGWRWGVPLAVFAILITINIIMVVIMVVSMDCDGFRLMCHLIYFNTKPNLNTSFSSDNLFERILKRYLCIIWSKIKRYVAF